MNVQAGYGVQVWGVRMSELPRFRGSWPEDKTTVTRGQRCLM